MVSIARLLRPRGNKGELLACSLSDRPGRFDHIHDVIVQGEARRIERVWWHDGRLILKFEGVDSIDRAETLRGAEVSIPADQRAPLDAGEYYLSDLVDCEVFSPGGARIGAVAGWQECGGPPLLIVESSDGELLIPFASTICREIDLGARRIVADLPEGLRELNRE